eukprot:scaffold5708_cov107-Isochrysis_galbana.AAC.20
MLLGRARAGRGEAKIGVVAAIGVLQWHALRSAHMEGALWLGKHANEPVQQQVVGAAGLEGVGRSALIAAALGRGEAGRRRRFLADGQVARGGRSAADLTVNQAFAAKGLGRRGGRRVDGSELTLGAGGRAAPPAGVSGAPGLRAAGEHGRVEELRVPADGARRQPSRGALGGAVGAELVGARQPHRPDHQVQADGA